MKNIVCVCVKRTKSLRMTNTHDFPNTYHSITKLVLVMMVCSLVGADIRMITLKKLMVMATCLQKLSLNHYSVISTVSGKAV